MFRHQLLEYFHTLNHFPMTNTLNQLRLLLFGSQKNTLFHEQSLLHHHQFHSRTHLVNPRHRQQKHRHQTALL
jgi:hypothetical protein